VKYVVIDLQPTGYWLDPEPYLGVLPELAAKLPPGARAFAEAPEHYDFSHVECVKDLWLQSIEHTDDAATLAFTANKWKHDRDLTLTYSGVVEVTFEGQRQVCTDARFGSLMLDELLPTDTGFTHEFMLTSGIVKITARDLTAEWIAFDDTV